MAEITSRWLENFFSDSVSDALRIEGFVDTADTRYLGGIGLSLKFPHFSSILGFSFSATVHDTAKFWTHPLRADVEGRDGLAVIYRQFERAKDQDTPEDLFAGWVPPEDALKLEGWVAEMNRRLRELIELKHRQKAENESKKS